MASLPHVKEITGSTPPPGKLSSTPPPGTPTPQTDYKRRPSKLPTRPRVKRFVRLPSTGHRDVEAPSLKMVQKALNAYFEQEVKKPTKYAKQRTEFHDEEGRMLVKGSGGGVYAGEIMGGCPHGRGEHRIVSSGKDPDHLLYRGDFEYGRKTGYGVVQYTNGQEYRGMLVDGMYYSNGSWYDGGWCKDSREGWGVFYWPRLRRKFEGDFTCNEPFTGCYTAMTPQEYEMLEKRQLEFPPAALGVVARGAPKENTKMVSLYLRHPFETNYVPVTRIRRCKDDHNPTKIFKRQVERRGSLTCDQIEALKHAYQAIAPDYLCRPTLLEVHLRRLLVTARIDPDLPQGEKLLAHLQRCAKESSSRNSNPAPCFTFSDFLFSIYRFHDP